MDRALSALLVFVFIAYVFAGKLGLSLAFVHASASAVWPPTGIALAVLLLVGYRVWPAILAGAFVVNFTTDGSLLTSAVIAGGNTLEAVTAAWLVNRYAGGARVFDRAPDIFRYALLAAVLSTTISATIGVTALAIAGSAPWSSYGSIWLTWWLGDAAGALIVAPAIVLWSRHWRLGYDAGRAIEAVLLLVVTVAVSFMVFGSRADVLGMARYPLGFLTLPPLLWAAFRFGPREASALIVLTSWIAIWGTLSGGAVSAFGARNDSLLVLQTFMATIAGMTLPTAAVVAERERAQQRLHTSEIAYRTMFEANPHPMWVVDRETMRFLAVNDAAVAHYGYARDEFLAMTTAEIRPFDDMPRLDRARSDLRTGRRDRGMHRHLTRDGRTIDVEVTAHPIEFAGREAALILAYDVTDTIRARERERQARAEAEQANRAKDEFLATLSHELRTPLNAMLGWTVLMREGGMDAATRTRALETVERNTRLQMRLIEDLLDVSRIVADKLTLELRPVAVTAVLEAAMEAVRPLADAKSIVIDRRVAPAIPLVMGDPARLQQIIWNLLANAVKFTDASGLVTVRLAAHGPRVYLRVTDTGRGIAPDFLPRIFDRFRQAETAMTRRHGGLGLGLTIARHLVERHGGAIKAESGGEGQGATFVVELPVARDPKQPAESADGQRSGTVLTGLRVLVVDDDADSRRLIGTMLERAGATAHPVRSASEARAELGRGAFDALIADLAMPEEDGYSLIRHVRALTQSRTLPAIAVSAYARQEDRDQALDAGFDLHVTKPVEPETLVDAVAEVVSRRKAG